MVLRTSSSPVSAAIYKQRPTRQWHRGRRKGVLERNQGSQNHAEQRKTRALICRGVLRTHCPSFVALQGLAEFQETPTRPREPLTNSRLAGIPQAARRVQGAILWHFPAPSRNKPQSNIMS